MEKGQRNGRLRRAASRSLFAVVALAVALTAVLPGTIRTLVCRYSGVVMPEVTCCPESQPADQGGASHLRQESCCLVQTVHLARLVSERQSATAEPLHPVVATVLTGTGAPLLARQAPSRRARGKLPVGPPLLLVKQAFLI